MVPTSKAIKDAIEAIIKLADPTCVVSQRHELEVTTGQSGNALRSAADGDRIHGWIILRGETINTRMGSVPHAYDDSVIDNAPVRLNSVIKFPILFLHWYDRGDPATNTDSTALFEKRIDDVIEAFTKKPRLAIATGACSAGNQIEQHTEFQVEEMSDPPIQFGNEWAHYASCFLIVKLFRTAP